MEAKQAAMVAKQYIEKLFGDEEPRNIGLEEIRFDEHHNIWEVTIGFSRSWEMPNRVQNMLGDLKSERSYKVVSLEDVGGKVLSVKSYGNRH
jgi:hypothetical protein